MQAGEVVIQEREMAVEPTKRRREHRREACSDSYATNDESQPWNSVRQPPCVYKSLKLCIYSRMSKISLWND
jgi:hypothetical protein